jgi:RimJ/RimL family protein N-acetyltransferase
MRRVALKNGRHVSVRLYVPDDFESVVSMFASFSDEAFRYDSPDILKDDAKLKEWTSQPNRDVVFVALDGDRMVGFAEIFAATGFRLKGIGTYVIYIHQDYQNQGLGRQVTELVLEEARKRGFHRLTLGVVAEHKAAIRVYERAGFQHEGRMREAYFADDQKYHDNLIMGIIL